MKQLRKFLIILTLSVLLTACKTTQLTTESSVSPNLISLPEYPTNLTSITYDESTDIVSMSKDDFLAIANWKAQVTDIFYPKLKILWNTFVTP